MKKRKKVSAGLLFFSAVCMAAQWFLPPDGKTSLVSAGLLAAGLFLAGTVVLLAGAGQTWAKKRKAAGIFVAAAGLFVAAAGIAQGGRVIRDVTEGSSEAVFTECRADFRRSIKGLNSRYILTGKDESGKSLRFYISRKTYGKILDTGESRLRLVYYANSRRLLEIRG